MNRHNRTFLADARNLGGRTQIVERMHNHETSLKRIKPVLNITAPHPHVDSARAYKGFIKGISLFKLLIGNQKDPKYTLVRATYNTIASMKKGLIDHSRPKTFGLIGKLSSNRKSNKHLVVEHVKNMVSLQKRLKRIESGNVSLFRCS